MDRDRSHLVIGKLNCDVALMKMGVFIDVRYVIHGPNRYRAACEKVTHSACVIPAMKSPIIESRIKTFCSRTAFVAKRESSIKFRTPNGTK